MNDYKLIQASILAARNDKQIQRDHAVMDFAEYTCIPTLRLRDCAYLFIGVEPEHFGENGQVELWAVPRIVALAESDHAAGNLLSLAGDSPDIGNRYLSLSDFITWARKHPSIALDPLPELTIGKPVQESKPAPDSRGGKMFAELVKAGRAMISEGVPASNTDEIIERIFHIENEGLYGDAADYPVIRRFLDKHGIKADSRERLNPTIKRYISPFGKPHIEARKQ